MNFDEILIAGVAIKVLEGHYQLYVADTEVMSDEWTPGPGDVCVDAGFGPGAWTLVALARGARVVAVDPRAYCHTLLEGALAFLDSPDCQVLKLGLHDHQGVLSFDEGAGRFCNGHELYPVITLDFLELPRLDYFNLDVEGCEMAVLDGARETLTRCKPKVIIEVHAGMQVEQQDVIEILRSYGYQHFRDSFGFLIAEYKEMA